MRRRERFFLQKNFSLLQNKLFLLEKIFSLLHTARFLLENRIYINPIPPTSFNKQRSRWLLSAIRCS